MEIKKGFADKYFLEKIYLSGYKSIQQTEIELKSNFNIIIGKNGAGKTNFMEFLNKVLNDDLNNIYDFRAVLNFNGKKNIEITTERKTPKNLIEKKVFTLNDELLFTVNIDGEVKTFKMNDLDGMVMHLHGHLIRSSSLIGHGIPIDYKFVNEPINLIADSNDWPGSQRAIFFARQPYLVHALQYSFLFGDLMFDMISSKRKFTLEDIKEHLSVTVFKEIEKLKKQLQMFSPISDVRFSKNFNISGNEETGLYKVENLFLEFNVNHEWYSFNSLSDGTKRLFYIISEITFSNEYFFRSLNFGSVVEMNNSRIILIEEPELGIHPHQLHKLMIFLKEQSQTKQIIITTHSPEALDILYEDELDSIILSEYVQEKGTLLRHMTDNEKSKAKRYMKEDFLSDYWMHSNLEPAN